MVKSATDTTTTLKIVQIIESLGLIPTGDPIDPVWILDIAQWQPNGRYFCEFQAAGDCDSGTVSWGTSDPYEPKFCSRHFFDQPSGYDFVENH